VIFAAARRVGTAWCGVFWNFALRELAGAVKVVPAETSSQADKDPKILLSAFVFLERLKEKIIA
jgi:hypothetical protein